jgi:hypothetical protein
METTSISECQPYFWPAILIIFYRKASHPHSELGHPYQSWGILPRKIGQPASQLGQPYRGRGIQSKCIRFSESALWSAIEKCALLFRGLFPIKCSTFQAQISHPYAFLKLIWSKSELSKKKYFDYYVFENFSVNTIKKPWKSWNIKLILLGYSIRML